MTDRYGTVEGLKAYAIEREVELPADRTDEEFNADLLVSSEWIDRRFGGNFPGRKVGGRAQLRSWPRYDAYDIHGEKLPDDEVPFEVVHATYEVAIRQASNPGSMMVDYTPSKYKQVSVDGAVSATFADFQSALDVQVQIPVLAMILAPLLSSSASLSSLTGGSVR